jgi:hypothetical protein
MGRASLGLRDPKICSRAQLAPNGQWPSSSRRTKRAALLRSVQQLRLSHGECNHRPRSEYKLVTIPPLSLNEWLRLTPKFLDEVQEWLFRAGWVLFDAGNTFAAVKVGIVENWPRLSYQRMEAEIRDAAGGTFKFDELGSLFSTGSDEDESED